MRIKKYILFDFIELTIGSFAIISSILTIITFFWHSYDKVFVFSVVCLIALSCVFFVKLLKIKKIADRRLSVFSENFHKLTDMIRNEFYEIKIQSEKDHLTLDYLLEKLKNVSRTAVNILSQCLTISTGQDVYATIKYFKTGSPDPGPGQVTDEMEVVTLCRSDNQPKKRIEDDRPSKIVENTDFRLIIEQGLPHFYASDLRKHSNWIKAVTGESYRNSNVNWSDYYISTIVVPIRIKRKFVDPEYSGEAYDILGFLCVDSKSKSAFRDSDMESYVNLVKAFADCLYQFFDRFLYYQKLITENKGE